MTLWNVDPNLPPSPSSPTLLPPTPDLQLRWADVQADRPQRALLPYNGGSHCLHILLLGSLGASGGPPSSSSIPSAPTC